MRYEIDVEFDDGNCALHETKAYFAFLEKYDASGIGHERTGTSTIFIKGPLNMRQIRKDLDGIKDGIRILSVTPIA